MDELKLVRAKAAAMGSIGVLIQYDREALIQILDLIKDHLLQEKIMATQALYQANLAIQKAKNGKA
jgi:D-arabinose 1-dehydrogenase-like Zn-dependent alcohol dehydrogenase